MEGELVRQAEVLFGEAVTRRLQERVAEARSAAPPSPDAGLKPRSARAADASPPDAIENAPALVRLQITTRQQRRLWTHVESIENFWESLQECEPGAIARLYELAAARRW